MVTGLARGAAWIAVLVLTVQPPVLAQRSGLPDIGSPADTVLSKSREARLGRSVMLQLRNAGAVVDDPQLTEYVNLLGSKLASQASSGEFEFEFFVVDDDAINAFALPGGYIGVNRGLIEATETESELAGVLAHEVSHVTQRHIARRMYDTQRTSIVSMATMLAAVLLGAAGDISGEAMQGIAMAGQSAIAQRQINYTRQNELEADRVGIEVLSSAGFDPHGMASFFDKLASRYGTRQPNVPEILQTHPVSTTRIADARARASRMPDRSTDDDLSYHLAKARVRVLGASTPSDAVGLFEDAADSSDPGRRYGRALALSRAGRNDVAERLFSDLVSESPGVIAYRIGRAEALMASGLTERALAIYEDAVKLSPRNVPLSVSYAEALIEAGRPGEAHRVLLDVFNHVQPTPPQIQLTARAANAAGKTARAHYYMAEYHVALASLTPAIDQLQMALESPDLSDVDRARFEARLDKIKEALAEREDD